MANLDEIRDVTVGPEDSVNIPQVSKFEIVLLNNHKDTYHPGQYIEGNVKLDLTESLVIKGVFIRFSGMVDNYWTEKKWAKLKSFTKCTETVEFQAAEEYFNEINLLRASGYIEADRHTFPFKFHLSGPLPETYEDSVCLIEYFLEARIKQDQYTWNDQCTRKDILVTSPLDLNNIIIPDVTLPVQAQKVTNLCCLCCRSQPITVFLRLQRSGYSPGETVLVQADVENNSRRSITPSCRIIEERTYRTKKKTLKQRDTLAEVKMEKVASYETKEFKELDIKLPKQQTFNVVASRIFTIRHFIEMIASPFGPTEKLTLSLELIIGAIPLKKMSIDTPAHQRLQTPAKHIHSQTAADIEHEKKSGKIHM